MQSKLAVQIERRFKAEIRAKYEGVTQNQNSGFTFSKVPSVLNESTEIFEHYD
jgi:hypothetical protein